MSTAILFNGAASYIAQEAGILDLLLGNIDGVPGVDLDIQDVKFVGGLSSGALMSFAFNVAFCESPKISWEKFKQDNLFNLKTEQVYLGEKAPFDTSPLPKFLEGITKEVGYELLKDLPFDSAILISFINIVQSSVNKAYWLTNIPKVASILPSQTDKYVIAKNIKDHQLEIKLISSLMCSTAIPAAFPPQELHYKGNSNQSLPIKNNLNQAAKFVDGGAGIDEMVFSAYREFFDAYGEKFDKIYFISPNFAKTESEALQRISLGERSGALEEAPAIDPLLIMDTWTNNFIKDIKTYNSEGHLANTIYYCKPEVEGFAPLDFATGKAQYDTTIAWGKNNPNKIAIDISTLT